MKDKDTISKGPKKRDPTCFQTKHAILIPAGTILRQDAGRPGTFSCPVAHGVFSVSGDVAGEIFETYKRVVG
jgi:hypothetical protein